MEKIKRIVLNQNEKQVFFLIQDLVSDPVKISVEAEIEKKELEKILKKLKWDLKKFLSLNQINLR